MGGQGCQSCALLETLVLCYICSLVVNLGLLSPHLQWNHKIGAVPILLLCIWVGSLGEIIWENPCSLMFFHWCEEGTGLACDPRAHVPNSVASGYLFVCLPVCFSSCLACMASRLQLYAVHKCWHRGYRFWDGVTQQHNRFNITATNAKIISYSVATVRHGSQPLSWSLAFGPTRQRNEAGDAAEQKQQMLQMVVRICLMGAHDHRGHPMRHL